MPRPESIFIDSAPSTLPQLGEALEVTSATESGAATSPQLGGLRGGASPSWGRLEGADTTTTLLGHQLYIHHGELGTPQPYSIRTDNVLSITLLLCFVVFVLMLSQVGHAVARQAKNFFFAHLSDDDAGGATAAPQPTAFYLFMLAACCFLTGIGLYLYATDGMGCYFAVESQSLLVALFTAEVGAYFLVKWLACSLVNTVFFGTRKHQQWNSAFLLLTAFEAALLYPLILLLVYFDLDIQKALFYFGIILFLNKILSFYKSWSIFFRRNGRFLQNFLYFCTLEMTPLLAFGGLWLMSVRFLKVNF